MSSPIAIPRITRESSPSRESIPIAASGSPAGLYVPVHKRSGSATSSLSSTSDLLMPPPRHKHASERRGRASPSPTRGAPSVAIRPATPARARLPGVYNISDLLALSSSPLVGISSAQQEDIEALLPLTAPQSGACPQKPARHHRARRTSTAKKQKKLPPSVSEDVETRRKRHGDWGWKPHTESEESWRHASAPAAIPV